MKKRIVIAGGGFAGLSALRSLGGSADNFEVTLLDRREAQEFLPLLPDVVGRGFRAAPLLQSLPREAQKYGARFVRAQIAKIDTENRRVQSSAGDFPYEYLLLAGGAVSNYYGTPELAAGAYELKSVGDALRLREAVLRGEEANIVVCGGGYTGVEAASAVHTALRGTGKTKNIILLNTAERLCAGLPPEFSAYLQKRMQALGIEVRAQNTVTGYSDHIAILRDGDLIENALLVWVAGVRTPDFLFGMNDSAQGQGRLVVDEHLQFAPGIFAAGDCAAFRAGGETLRMSVQYALTGGRCAAGNILRLAEGRPLLPFKPFDPGYVVPVEGGSCGEVMGVRLYGRIPGWLHYMVCAARSSSLRNGMGVFRQWIGI